MTDYLKWVVSGAAGAIFVGALIGVNRMNAHPQGFARTESTQAVADNSQSPDYPAPDVTVVSQIERPDRDTEVLERSSSMYGDTYVLSRRRHAKHKTKHKKTDTTPTIGDNGLPKDADPEMGLIAADDKKLKDAEAQESRSENSNFAGNPGPVGH